MSELNEMTTLDIVDCRSGLILRENVGREYLFQMFIDTQWRFVSFTRPEVGGPYMMVDTINLRAPGFSYLDGSVNGSEYDPNENGGFV